MNIIGLSLRAAWGARNFPGYYEHNIWLLSQETREKLELKFNFNFLLN